VVFESTLPRRHEEICVPSWRRNGVANGKRFFRRLLPAPYPPGDKVHTGPVVKIVPDPPATRKFLAKIYGTVVKRHL
jgi:hypothetical protein